MKRYSPLVLILIILGALGVSQVATAATTPATGSTSTLFPQSSLRIATPEEETEGEEEGELEIEEEELIEECEATAEEFEFENEAEEEEFEEEAEECEEEATAKGGKNKAFVTAPAVCTVQRAESTITTLPGSDRVLLTIHYKAASATPVAIGLKLKDHKGSLALERTTKHLGKNGTLHLTTKLGETEMERAEIAREFDVALRVPGTPGYCGNLLEQHLKTQTATASKAHGSSAAHGSRARSSRVYRAPRSKHA
jgi:hypothetical protein